MCTLHNAPGGGVGGGPYGGGVLDLVSVAGQLRRMRADLAGFGDDVRLRLGEGLGAWERAAALGPRLRDRVARAKTSWLVADPLEPLAPVPVPPVRDYRVLASDGSQVFPDRHESGPCFLVNVGLVDIDYTRGSARLTTEPTVLYAPEDTYPLMGGVRQEADGRVVAARRFAGECEALAAAIAGAGTRPLVALTDGTLLLWWLEPEPDRLNALGPDDLKTRAFGALETLTAAAAGAGALLAGYLSAPRSADVVSMLKVILCTEDPVDCDRCPYASGAKTWTPLHASGGMLPDPSRPCEEAESLTDAALFAAILEPGWRSPRFRSAAKVTAAYASPVDFVYLHTGAEVARLEFPAWTTPESLAELAGCVADQCAKGLGYPVALSEAHEQAVVRYSDRRAFLDLVRRGDPELSRPSAKLARKRTSVL